MLKVLSSILCDLDPKVKVIGQKAGICDGVPSTSALVLFDVILYVSLSTIFQLCRDGSSFVCLIRLFMCHQQSFSYVGTGLPGLNQY